MAGSTYSDILRQIPGPVGELARRGFGGAALLLIRHHGGTRIWLPHKPDGKYADLIGSTALAALIDIAHGAGHLEVPSPRCLDSRAKGEVARLLAMGMGTTATARAAGVTERYVRMSRQNQETPPRRRKKDESNGTIDMRDFLAELGIDDFK